MVQILMSRRLRPRGGAPSESLSRRKVSVWDETFDFSKTCRYRKKEKTPRRSRQEEFDSGVVDSTFMLTSDLDAGCP